MADLLYFSRDTKVILQKGSDRWELPVLDGFSFSQATNTSEITLQEMAAPGATSTVRRGKAMFNDSLAPAEWNFSTYIRPFKSNGSGTGGAASNVTDHHAVEELLWAAFVGDANYTTNNASGAVTNVTVSGGSTPDKIIFNTQDQTSRFPEVLKYLKTARNDFNTETGVVKPDTTGWTALNKAPTSIKSATIASVSTTPNNFSIKSVSSKGSNVIVALTNKQYLLNGDRITITGTNRSELNNNVYYVNKKGEEAGIEYKLYTDSTLQTQATNLVPRSNEQYKTGGHVVATHTAVITAAGSGSSQAFTDTSDVKITEFNIGDQITFSNTNSDLNNGLYIVKGTTTNSEGNINTITVEGVLPLSVSSSTTNIGSPTISLSQISIKPRLTADSLDSKVVLVNESAQPAGITCKGRMTAYQRYHVEVEADRLINIKITDHAGQNRLNLNQLHHEGTITPGKIKASIRQALVSPTTGEVDSETLASATVYGYRNNQSSAIQSMNEDNLFDVFTNNIPTQYAAGGADLVEQTTSYNSAVGQELQTSESYNDPVRRAFNRDWFLAYPHLKSLKWQFYADGSTSSVPLTDATTGTLNSTTFSDVGGTTRTIQDFWWFGHDMNRKDRKGIFCFSLQGTNIPNTDTTFGGLNVNKVGFRRDQAFYSPNQNGNTVWWWHLSANPISGSDIEKLGEGVTNFSIIKNVGTYGKNKDLFKATAPADTKSGGLWASASSPYNSIMTTYDITLSNIGTATNITDVVSSAKFTRRGNDHYYGTARETSLVTQYDTTNFATSSSKPTYDSIDSTDMLGTPPLIAQFKKTSIAGQTTNKDLVSTKSITSGAVYPSPVIGLSATNDASDQETGVSLSKYGWNSGFDDTKLSVTTPETPETTVASNTTRPPSITAVSITSGNVENPIIPNNAGNFTVGNPVTTNITANFQWQKSEDGIEFEDIESTDSVYTNSTTGQLTVTGYTDADEVEGLYFRCKVFIDDAIEYTNTVVSKQAEDPYATTFYLFAGSGASGTGFGFYDEVVDSFDAGQVSENPAFSSSVEGRNDGDLAINKGVVYYLYRESNGDLKLQLDGPGSEVTTDANFTLTFTRSVNNSGTGGTAGGSVSTGVPGSANRAATYTTGYGFATWTWASANVPSEVAATFNSASSFNPIKVVVVTTT